MKFAFRKIETVPWWFVPSHAIGWITGGKYCHVEGVFSDGMWFGAVLKGTRFADDIKGNPGKWDFVEIPMTRQRENRLRFICELLEGRKYDLSGLAEYITFGIVKQDPRASYCSEIWRRLLSFKSIGLLPRSTKKCPPSGKGGLYEMLVKLKGGE